MANTREGIEKARGEIEAAEEALGAAMRLVDSAPRSEKITISQALEQAFERLRAAKTDLAELEKKLPPDA